MKTKLLYFICILKNYFVKITFNVVSIFLVVIVLRNGVIFYKNDKLCDFIERNLKTKITVVNFLGAFVVVFVGVTVVV